MNLAIKIARKYFLSKKSTNAINIISLISMTGMMVCTAAFILVLSVFNGFEGLVISLYNSFYSDMRIEATEGKVFKLSEDQRARVESLPGVFDVSGVLEENALLMYSNRQHIATLKGVEASYGRVTGIDSTMAFGDAFVTEHEGQQYAVVGSGIDMALNISLRDPINRLAVYMPRREQGMAFFQMDEFRRADIMTWGVFAIQEEFDNQYIFVPIDFIRNLLQYENELSALEIGLHSNANHRLVQRQIQEILGDEFTVLNRFQQNAFLYRIMNIEKLAVYVILSFIFLIVAFNMIGSLSMIVIDKRKDIGILKTMGANDSLIRRIFLYEGMLQSAIAILLGFAIAISLLLIQQNYGLITIQGTGSFIVQYYPVKMKATDFLIVSMIVFSISVIASWFPAARAARQAQLVQ